MKMLGTIPEGRKAPAVTELTVWGKKADNRRANKSRNKTISIRRNHYQNGVMGNRKHGGEEALLGWEAEGVRAVTGNKNRPQGARSYRSS